jgi:hypothetical protein
MSDKRQRLMEKLQRLQAKGARLVAEIERVKGLIAAEGARETQAITEADVAEVKASDITK